VSFERESKLDTARTPPGGPPPSSRWILTGYLLGVLAMSPAPVLYFWFFAPVVPLLIAGAAVLAGVVDRRFHAVAAGSAAAAVFGAVTVFVFFIGIANTG
jgi:hypothetical protein